MRKRIFSKMFGEPKTLPESLQSILWLGRLLGLSVIEYPSGHPWLKLSIIHSFIRCSLYGLLVYYCETNIFRKSNFKMQTTYTVYYLIRFLSIVTVIATTVLNISAYKAKSLYIKGVTVIDAILKEFGIDPEYSKERSRHLYICFIWFALGAVINATAYLAGIDIYNSHFDTFIKTIVYAIPLSINLFIELKIGEYISIIARRFERLNALTHRIVESTRGYATTKNVNKYHRILQSNRARNAFEDSNMKYKDNIVVMLKTVRQIHLHLCKVARKTMETYGAEILLQLNLTFVTITGFSYIAYLNSNESTMMQITKIYQHTFVFSLIIISFSAMVFISNSSGRVMEEAKKASQIAYEIQSLDQEVLNEIHQLSLQVMQHPLYLTASNLFVLDFVYVRGIIGATATYFMILIQNRPTNSK